MSCVSTCWIKQLLYQRVKNFKLYVVQNLSGLFKTEYLLKHSSICKVKRDFRFQKLIVIMNSLNICITYFKKSFLKAYTLCLSVCFVNCVHKIHGGITVVVTQKYLTYVCNCPWKKRCWAENELDFLNAQSENILSF